MEKVENIFISDIKPKEKSKKLIELLINKKIEVDEFINFFIGASDVKKGTCADVLKHIAKLEPELLFPYIDLLINYIDYNAPRVKWGIQETIGNLAEKYPKEVAKAIPKLLQNTKENKTNTTVVRWCAAYGITGILVNNKDIQKELVPKIQEIVSSEKNNGVKNLYKKALKKIS